MSPFCERQLSAVKPKISDYPSDPKTTGEHLKAARLDRGLTQREVAALLGVSKPTLGNWETGFCVPAVRALPAIVSFLGFNPTPPPDDLPGRMKWYRTTHGLNQRAAGKRANVGLTSWWALETGYKPVSPKVEGKIMKLVIGIQSDATA
ncbi:MAG: helix-turn-helix transcriptional regulator [Planctomycetota bacterium]